MKTNKKAVTKTRTHGGAISYPVSAPAELSRAVLTNLLWEDQYYESGEDITKRITRLIPMCDPSYVADLAIEARTKMKLRHMPLFLCREMFRYPAMRKEAGRALYEVIQRVDEIAEFVAMYWKTVDGYWKGTAGATGVKKKEPLAAQAKKALAKAFQKFGAYQFSKYDRDTEVKLRDVMFLTHPKPTSHEKEDLFKQIAQRNTTPAETWESVLSAGKENKKEAWSRLLIERKMGALAILRNLRNMTEARVPTVLVKEALAQMDVERVLPFRFISAAKYAPGFEPELEAAMYRAIRTQDKLPGKTVLVLDVSGSMHAGISAKSDTTRLDASNALAILFRELCWDVSIWATAGSDASRIHDTRLVAPRHGFALADKLNEAFMSLGQGGIFLKQCLDFIYDRENHASCDRLIVITDEQDCDLKCNPTTARAFGKRNYIINVGSYQNGIDYGKWVKINGWSERVIDYIRESERQINEILQQVKSEQLNLFSNQPNEERA